MDQNLPGRVTRLERENRRLRLGGLMATVLLGGMLLLGQAAPSEIPKEIKAHQFTVVDEDGKSRAKLGQTGFTLLNDKGEPVVLLGSVQHGQRLLAFFEDGRPRLMLGKPDPDGTFLWFPKGQIKLRASLGVSDNGSPSLVLRGSDGKAVWQSPPKEE